MNREDNLSTRYFDQNIYIIISLKMEDANNSNYGGPGEIIEYILQCVDRGWDQ